MDEPVSGASRISSRNAPKLARSTELVPAILEAAIQVLAQGRAQRFTTARFAEKAGVSVGARGDGRCWEGAEPLTWRFDGAGIDIRPGAARKP